jgi:Chaperone of endosialidase
MSKSKIFQIILTVVMLITLVISISADIPGLINYQGRLTDAQGANVPDGTYNIDITIYTSAEGDDDIWWCLGVPVEVVDGLFNLLIGEACEIPDDAFLYNPSLWMGITLEGQAEMVPRTQLVSAPYAYHALRADTAGYVTSGTAGWVDDGSVVRLESSDDYVGIGTATPNEQLVVNDDLGPLEGNNIVIGDSSYGGSAGIVFGESGNTYTRWSRWNYPNTVVLENHVGGFVHYPFTIDEGRICIGSNEIPGEPLVVGKDLGSYTGDLIVVGNDQAGQYSGIKIGEDSDNNGNMLWSNDNNYLYFSVKSGGTNTNLMVLKSGKVGVGTNSPNYTLDVRGSIGNNTTLYHSDKRWKRDIQELDGSLNRVMKLQGVQYKWRQEEYPEMNFPDDEQIGLIAQDVEKIIPELVKTSADGYQSIDYAKLVPVLIESIKEQQQQIEILSNRIEELEEIKITDK